MIELRDLPSINACLNATSALFLFLGYFFVRKKEVEKHKFCMVSALVVSGIFLVCYVIYHYAYGSTKFQGEGWVRTLYFAILLSHTILAISLVVLVPMTVRYAIKGQFDKHRRIAKWTFPIWAYVCVTGVLVYFMLYHWFAPG